MRINTNINSMRTQEYMRQNQAKMSNAMDRLSSGKRINNASDDAAGLAIATRMRARESGLGVAANNTQDGMALIRTADSAMNSVSNILLRMRDLANQSANGTNTDKNQAALQKEFSELQKQIDYISSNTQFNDKNLLDGSNKTINIQTLDSEDGSRQIGIELGSASTKALGIDTLNIGSNKITEATKDYATETIGALTTGSNEKEVALAKKSFDQIKGAISNADAQALAQAFENYDNAASGEKGAKAAEIKNVYNTITNFSMAKVSEDVYNDAKTAITGLKATSTGKEVAAAREHFDKIKDYLSKSDRTNLENAFKAFDGTDTTAGSAAGKQGSDIAGKFPKTDLSVAKSSDDSAANPLQAIRAIDAALKTIADNRATLGATLNRLDFNVNNLKSQQSSMASAASQVEDADMAKEMSEMTKFKILNEAGISMLSQANQTPQMVSKLLQ
ncbi:TPA: flagellin [Bacillus pacificus]|uniref:flagellin N-terminal helical domain-containing protein n=1 Tax=Bacillus cereus group TaxID=86661 RepID=UPI0009427ADC|nr:MULTISPECIES: flagellin [Bacillus cereus group]MCU5371235.1 flagellin [Bacillus pacificus]MDA1944658.1 flagellin [Bacillus cereus group sp. BcHK124]